MTRRYNPKYFSQGGSKKSPGLRIKIDNSSFAGAESDLATAASINAAGPDLDLDLLASRSPTLHISGIAISRSPGQMSPASPSFRAPVDR